MSPALRIPLGLIAGLGAGVLAGTYGAALLDEMIATAGVVGGLWLDALRVTIVPLVFALVVTGIAAAASSARGGGIAARALAWFAALLFFSALLAAFLVPLMLSMWTPAPAAVEELRATFGGAAPAATPPVTEWLRSFVPTNIVASAAEGAILPLVLFALLFGVALACTSEDQAAPVLAFFHGIVSAMLLIVRWILFLAPVGVFALAFVVGAKVGVGAGGVLAHFVIMNIVIAVILALLMYPLAVYWGKVPLRSFARAIVPAQAVAGSTQSSLASLPPMLAGAERLGLPLHVSGVVLPLAVAVFRITVPCAIVIGTLTMASLHGIEVGLPQLAVLVLLATLNTLVSVGLPGGVAFFAVMTPPALAVGVPVELLPLLLAVDALPDIFRTAANVTADVAVTAVVARNATAPETRDESAEAGAA